MGKYQYGSFRSVKILSSDAIHQPFCRAHDLTNCRAFKVMTTTAVRQSF
jgi:hypothetical protein